MLFSYDKPNLNPCVTFRMLFDRATIIFSDFLFSLKSFQSIKLASIIQYLQVKGDPISKRIYNPDEYMFGLDLPVILALVGSLSVLIIGAVVFAVLLKRDMSAKRKLQGLSSAAEIDAEARIDYQVEYNLFLNLYLR